MAAHKAPAWTAAEVAILREFYPAEGIAGVCERLPGRSWHSIHVKAHKLGIRCLHNGYARKARLHGAELDEAIRLREQEGWSYARIGAHYGIAETSASNAVLIALCKRQGFTPAQRNPFGALTEEGRERVRYALKKGLKAIDIQLRLGVSAACVAEQRRRYNAELKARGKALLPPPGGGLAYSGRKLDRETRAKAETLFLQGFGTQKVAERSGMSRSSCIRLRERIVKRLRRKGECLPGCDIDGNRHTQVESANFIAEGQRTAFRELLRDGVPVSRAARMTAIGGSAAYRLRDAIAAELTALGKTLPTAQWRGRPAPQESNWPPSTRAELISFRQMLQSLPFEDAKAQWRRDRDAERRAEAKRPKSFEEQLARVAAGKVGLVAALPRTHLEPKRNAA